MFRIRTSTIGTGGGRGFTLIELLVVIAIIAMLTGILLPSLSAARRQGQALKCAANLHDIAVAMSGYLADWDGVYPPAYLYPKDELGNYDFFDQPSDHPYGYIHWSWFLYSKGQVSDKTFQCPSYPKGGAPRTNPGSNENDWEGGQVDQNGGGRADNAVQDAQAPRMAYAGNAAVFPRNKFTTDLSGGLRVNVFTMETKIGDTAKTILMTEYNDNWESISNQEGGGLLSKSHRSISPFVHIGTGSDEYQPPLQTPGFTYGDPPYYGLMSRLQLENVRGLLDTPAISETNAVGRHHPGGDPYSGGTANFLYADGHVERKSVLQSVEQKDWGLSYYSINGNNKVGPPW